MQRPHRPRTTPGCECHQGTSGGLPLDCGVGGSAKDLEPGSEGEQGLAL